MTTKEFALFKKTGLPLKEIRQQGLFLEGEHTPLDSVKIGRYRGSFRQGYQYKVVNQDGLERHETAIPVVKEGALDLTDPNSIYYKFSDLPEYAIGMWV